MKTRKSTIKKNRKFHRGINTSPYNALFGHEAYNGLEIIKSLSDEQRKGITSARELFSILGENVEEFEDDECEIG